jgi:hypothetical protein
LALFPSFEIKKAARFAGRPIKKAALVYPTPPLSPTKYTWGLLFY